jgi:hypothetical protein
MTEMRRDIVRRVTLDDGSAAVFRLTPNGGLTVRRKYARHWYTVCEGGSFARLLRGAQLHLPVNPNAGRTLIEVFADEGKKKDGNS